MSSDRSDEEIEADAEKYGYSPGATRLMKNPERLDTAPNPDAPPHPRDVWELKQKVDLTEAEANEVLNSLGDLTIIKSAAQADNAIEKMAAYPGISQTTASAVVREFREDEA